MMMVMASLSVKAEDLLRCLIPASICCRSHCGSNTRQESSTSQYSLTQSNPAASLLSLHHVTPSYTHAWGGVPIAYVELTLIRFVLYSGIPAHNSSDRLFNRVHSHIVAP
jgi:hypothetical protein